MKKACLYFCAMCIAITCSSWGFFAHKKINHLAVFTLPSSMIRFYKNNISYLTDHAVDPDKRRYTDSAEAPRHYLDADHYGKAPFDSLPERWDDAVKKLSSDTLTSYGIVPWQIQKSYYALVKAFQDRDSSRILHLSADLGHYVADAHVPLHTTQNHNGQLSNQVGIHGFWESRLPELFSESYDYFTGRAQYIDNPLKEAWKIVRNTYSYKDSVLFIEARLSKKFPSDRKYSFIDRNGKVIRDYSEEYSRSYHKALGGMVERQMRASIHDIGCFWYSAWVDAGQPDLINMPSGKKPLVEKNASEVQGRMIGRPED